MTTEDYRQSLLYCNLKVTPQRLAVLEALNNLKGHPPAERISEYVISKNPNIAVGTIYNILDTFVEKGLIKKINTENAVMRYDPVPGKHHHLYDEESDIIEDYFDEELDNILKDYFSRKKIPKFTITEIQIQISGVFQRKR